MAELMVVGRLVSPIIGEVIKKAGSYVVGQYNWKKGTEEDLKKLKSSLIGLQYVVAVAERRQTWEPREARLLRQLNDAVYEADDLLDEFEYQDMEARAREAEGTVSHVASSSVQIAKQLIGRDNLRTKLTEILNKLDDVKKNAELFVKGLGLENNNAIEQAENSRSRITSSILPKTEIFGRDDEKNEIVSLLTTDELESSDTNISVICIVGVGGVGKTTLAQFVYNDNKILDYFDIRMWVCVADGFDEYRLTRVILESAFEGKENHKDFQSFDILQNKLQAHLKCKRFLLVLDDVWPNEKRSKLLNQNCCKKILAPLKDGARGSKILVTTRMTMVAEMFGMMEHVSLNGLTSDDTWHLLQKCAFGDVIPDNYQELKEIGTKIVTRLNGSPLAASVVGGMLKDTQDPKKWLKILERKFFDDIMSILSLSYERLPNHLKSCFSYCSIFPKNWYFDCKELVHFWIAQGYVEHPFQPDKSIIDIGMDYFNELFSRSFFQKVQTNSHTYYVMHDLIHDLAQFTSTDECFTINDGKQRKIPETIRHLSVSIYSRDEFKDFMAQWKKMSNLRNLRTLLFFGTPKDAFIDFPLVDSWSLRALHLGGLKVENFSGALSHLRHLRYLHLGYNGFQVFPKSPCRLYHLQVLEGSHPLLLCESICRLFKFGKLTWLNVPWLEFNVEKKRHPFQVLKGVCMEVLQRTLFIENLQNVSSREEAVEADLGSKQYLDSLLLEWGSPERRIIGNSADEEVAEALEQHSNLKVAESLVPHPNLKQLTIQGFRGSRCPNWLERRWLVNLESFVLTHCLDLEALPLLDHLPSLKRLEVKQCPKLLSFPVFPCTLWKIIIEHTGLISYLILEPRFSSPSSFVLRGSFIPSAYEALLHNHHLQAIEELQIRDCSDAQVLPSLEQLPLLKRLEVSDCPKLMSFPLFPPTLREIVICRTGLISHLQLELERGCLLSSSIALESSVIPSLYKALLHNQHFQAIETPVIRDCKELMLERELLGHTALKKLRIIGCQELLMSEEEEQEEDDSGIQISSLLESLVIENFIITDMLLSRCLQSSLASLSELMIGCCTGLTSLPSAQVLHCMTALQRLEIEHCEDLISLGGLYALTSLQKLYVGFCKELASLEGLQALASLNHLHVENCSKVKSMPEQGLPASLKELSFRGCGVPDVSVVRCLQGLTSLSTLKIDCWSEMVLPLSLESLEIWRCGVSDMLLSACLQGDLSSLSVLKIMNCTNLTSLPSAQVLHCLPALWKLEIHGCEDLTSLGGLHALVSLKHLALLYCPKLKSLPEERLPASIEYISLVRCHPALQQQIRNKEGLNWDKVAHIRHVRF